MLKLLKHDLKDSYLEVVILSGIALAASFLVFAGYKLNISFIATIGQVGFVFGLSALQIILLITIIKSFHTKLFTNCGYLTLTTPVSLDKILISKILVSMLWVFTAMVTTIGCVFIIFSASSSFFISLFNSLVKSIINNPFETFKGIVIGLAAVLFFLTTLIFILVLTNTGWMKKHKLLKGILLYLAFAMITSQVAFIFTSYVWYLSLFLVVSVIMYLLSRWLITTKLELE